MIEYLHLFRFASPIFAPNSFRSGQVDERKKELAWATRKDARSDAKNGHLFAFPGTPKNQFAMDVWWNNHLQMVVWGSRFQSFLICFWLNIFLQRVIQQQWDKLIETLQTPPAVEEPTIWKFWSANFVGKNSFSTKSLQWFCLCIFLLFW